MAEQQQHFQQQQQLVQFFSFVRSNSKNTQMISSV